MISNYQTMSKKTAEIGSISLFNEKSPHGCIRSQQTAPLLEKIDQN
ncbi:hypothetical protein QNF03_000048 [Vibrio cidicii]|jgi:hypothetical protein|nr:hypothetical protein [Vibrio cidicii]ELV8623445.1 hypothetical protein [Vibrio cidicii]